MPKPEQKPAPNVTAITDAIAKAAQKSKLRERIEQAKQAQTVKQKETVTVDELGLTFEVWPMPIGKRLDLYQMVTEQGEGAVGPYLITLVHESTRDPETGERVWGPEEEEEVRGLPPEIFNPLSQAAQRVNATTKEVHDAVGNASAAILGGGSSSGSPANSEVSPSANSSNG